MGLDAMILVFWMLSFMPAFSLSSFIFIKRLFSSFLLFKPKKKKKKSRVLLSSTGTSSGQIGESLVLKLVIGHSVSNSATFGLQHAMLPCPSPTPGVCSNSCSLSQWCHPTISSSVVPFSSHLQSFPKSGSFPMRQFFASGGQSTGAST